MKRVCPQQTEFLASFKQLPNKQAQVKNTLCRSYSLFVVCLSDANNRMACSFMLLSV